MKTESRLFDWCWLIAWGVVSSVWCITAADQLGATFDEPVYIEKGLEYWRTGSRFGLLRLGTMPLPVDVTTLPLYVWERWRGEPLRIEEEWQQLLPVARAGTLVFWWLLLFYGRLAGRQLAGPWGGRLAVALIAVEPSLLAHAALATTDVAVTACLLPLVYHFRTARNAGWPWRVGVPMLWFAAATLAKASGLVYGGLCLVIVELERLAREGAFWEGEAPAEPGANGDSRLGGSLALPRNVLARLRFLWLQLRPLCRDLFWIVGGGMVLVFLYCGSDWQPLPSFINWAQGLPEGPARQLMVPLSERLCIFSNAGVAIVRQFRHNLQGHGTYLLGHTDPRALWYYFPVVLTIKLSLPLLLMPLALLAVRPRTLTNWACIAAGALLLFSLTCRVQIGIRLVLPLVALGIVGLSAAVVEACKQLEHRRRLLVLAGAALGIVWTAGVSLSAWPHGLSYVNELWGRAGPGYILVSEANYDWGQGVKELACWQKENGRGRLNVWYFGTDPAIKDRLFRQLPLHAQRIDNPVDLATLLRGQRLAVSTTLVYGPYGQIEAHRQAVAFLRACQPTARTTTFLIYDFRKPPPHSARCN